jgi:hypothetical protein
VTETQATEYGGFRVEIVPVGDEPFYFTGDQPQFNIRITNLTGAPRSGWFFFRGETGGLGGEGSTFEASVENSPPGLAEVRVQPGGVLTREGRFVYKLLQVKDPVEAYGSDKAPLRSESRRAPFVNLCSFKVFDQEEYVFKQRANAVRDKRDRRRWLVLVLIGSIAAAATVLELILHFG